MTRRPQFPGLTWVAASREVAPHFCQEAHLTTFPNSVTGFTDTLCNATGSGGAFTRRIGRKPSCKKCIEAAERRAK